MLRLFAFVLLLVLPIGASADEMVAVRGSGSKSCSQYIADTSGSAPGDGGSIYHFGGKSYYSASALDAQWILAYLTGLNSSYSEMMPRHKQITVDFAAADLFIRDWCSANPTSYLVAAVAALAQIESQK